MPYPHVGIILRLTHTGKAGDSVLISDLGDGTDSNDFRKVGPVYVPRGDQPADPGYIDITYSTDVAISYRQGAIRKFIDGGYLLAEFFFGPLAQRAATGTVTVSDYTYTVRPGDRYLRVCVNPPGPVTIQLPPIAEHQTQVVYVIDAKGMASVHNITVFPAPGETINGLGWLTITTDYGFADLYADCGTDWNTIPPGGAAPGAGAGLYIGGGDYNVGVTGGLIINPDDIAVGNGGGLIINANDVEVGAGEGIIVNANDVAVDWDSVGPVNVTKAAAAIGVSLEVSRADHKHDIDTATAVTVGTANAEGVSSSLARADHVHDHGNQPGGTLHALATTLVAGFMSAADKVKLDGLPHEAARAKLQFSQDINVPGGGTLFLAVGNVVTSSAPVRMIRAGQFTGASISVNVVDGARDYKLSVELNDGGGFVEVESLALPLGVQSAETPAFTTSYAAGDLLRVSVVRTAGVGGSTFSNINALVELKDVDPVPVLGALLTESGDTLVTEGGDTLVLE